MPPYTLSKAAENDIASIADYTVETFGIDQAIAYRDGLIRAFGFLAEFPRAARERTELRRNARVYPYQSHLIIYRIDGDGILIQRVRHAREDWINDPPSQNT
jgi:toxin ParE1/3/4